MPSVVVVLVAAAALLVSGCGGREASPEPGITCNDGYVAHPSYTEDREGCGPHSGVVDPFMDELNARLDELPDGPVVGYICHDGWRSLSVGEQGACSYHGGVWRTVYPDGAQVVVDGPGIGTVYKPDGTVVQPSQP